MTVINEENLAAVQAAYGAFAVATAPAADAYQAALKQAGLIHAEAVARADATREATEIEASKVYLVAAAAALKVRNATIDAILVS